MTGTRLEVAGAILGGKFLGATCPQTAAKGVQCYGLTTKGVVRGLGTVSESGVLMIGAPDTKCETLESTPVLAITGKGTIMFSAQTAAGSCIDGSCGCGNVNATQPLTVTGGTGDYAGASGSGTVTTQGTLEGDQFETFKATIVAPNANFDLTPPLIRAVARVVHAAKGKTSAHVHYTVTAKDAVDGPVPVNCRPASGSLFKLGHTHVTCTAHDASANASTARFTITVKPS